MGAPDNDQETSCPHLMWLLPPPPLLLLAATSLRCLPPSSKVREAGSLREAVLQPASTLLARPSRSAAKGAENQGDGSAPAPAPALAPAPDGIFVVVWLPRVEGRGCCHRRLHVWRWYKGWRWVSCRPRCGRRKPPGRKTGRLGGKGGTRLWWVLHKQHNGLLAMHAVQAPGPSKCCSP